MAGVLIQLKSCKNLLPGMALTFTTCYFTKGSRVCVALRSALHMGRDFVGTAVGRLPTSCVVPVQMPDMSQSGKQSGTFNRNRAEKFGTRSRKPVSQSALTPHM